MPEVKELAERLGEVRFVLRRFANPAATRKISEVLNDETIEALARVALEFCEGRERAECPQGSGVTIEIGLQCVGCEEYITEENRGGYYIETWPDGVSGPLCCKCNDRIKPTEEDE